MFKEGREGTEKLPTPDSHVDGESEAKTIVYNMKRDSKKKKREKHRKGQKVEEIQQ